MNNISLFEAKLNQAIGQQTLLINNIEQQKTLIETTTKRLQAIEKAQALIQTVAQETQNMLVYQINDIVNTALQTCFPNEYEFHIEFKIQRNKTEAKLIFTKNGYEINPLLASGGGVVDMAAFGLRIAAWSLSNTSNTIIIDEGFKFLSRDLQPKAAEILSEISKKLNVQIIQSSHSSDIIEKSDKIFTVTLINGISKVTTSV